MEPLFAHDCTRCQYLGRYDHKGQSHDLYTCQQEIGGPTVIARWSDDPADYESGLSFGMREGSGLYSTPLQEAHARAVIRGFLPPPMSVAL